MASRHPPLTPVLRTLFAEMRDAEMALDDFDYLTESPKYQRAMAAARRFNDALAKHDAGDEPKREAARAKRKP